MSKFIIITLVTFSLPALACFNEDAQSLTAKQIKIYAAGSNETFQNCLDLLAAEGVDLNEVNGARQDREDGDNENSVIYTIMVQGEDSAGRTTRIYAKYYLNKNGFTCEPPTRNIPKCF